MVETKNVEIVTSPAGSFKGYDESVWWKKNKGFIKNSIVFALFLLILCKMIFAEKVFNVETIIVVSSASAVAIKKALDALDFFATEKTETITTKA